MGVSACWGAGVALCLLGAASSAGSLREIPSARSARSGAALPASAVSVTLSSSRSSYRPGQSFVVSAVFTDASGVPLARRVEGCLGVQVPANRDMAINATTGRIASVRANQASRQFTPCWSLARLRPHATRRVAMRVTTSMPEPLTITASAVGATLSGSATLTLPRSGSGTHPHQGPNEGSGLDEGGQYPSAQASNVSHAGWPPDQLLEEASDVLPAGNSNHQVDLAAC